MKRITLILIVFFLNITSVYSLELSSKNYIIYNLDNNQVVISKKEEDNIRIASLTKIMTNLVAIEKIKNLDSKVTITYEMIKGFKEANAAMIGLYVGEKVTYRDLLYGSLLASGAEATRALAISLSGSEKKFVDEMNKKAKILGLVNTHFTNTTGLDEDGQKSSAKDVALLLKAAIANETFKKIFETNSYTLSNKRITVYSTMRTGSKMLNLNMSYITGGKTGYTDLAGRCLASIAYDSKNDIHYLLVNTGASTDSVSAYHVRDAKKIYDYVFSNYKNHSVVIKGDLLTTVKTKYSEEKARSFYIDKDIYHYYDKSFDSKKTKIEYNGIDELSHKMKVGKKLGTVTIKYDEEILDKIEIVLDKEIEFSFMEFVYVHKLIFISGGVVVLLILVLFIVIGIRKKLRKCRV